MPVADDQPVNANAKHSGIAIRFKLGRCKLGRGTLGACALSFISVSPFSRALDQGAGRDADDLGARLA